MGRPKKKIKLNCLICNKEFERHKYDIEKRNARYCSMKCLNQSHKKDIPVEVLDYLYVQLKYSMNKISDMLNCTDHTVKRNLTEAGIPVRNMPEAVSLSQIGTKHSARWNKAIAKGHRNMSAESRRNHVQAVLKCSRNYGNRSKGGYRSGLGIYVRSSWENNYGAYLNYLIAQGEITNWQYELDTFEFNKIKRGVRSYTPDFKVHFADGHYEYHEVKGYMDSRSATKLKRFAKYYPEEKLVLIDADWFKAMKRQGFDRLIEGWE